MTKPTYYIGKLESELLDGKWIDGLAAGEFDNGWSEVEILSEDLPIYVANTLSVLESTQDEAGMVVGFPIDSGNHDHGPAAGWITDIRLIGDKLAFKPKWTKLGQELVSEGLMRYFSAEIDLKKKVVLGGSLTNWPATVDEEENRLLQPVELSKENPLMKLLKNVQKSIESLGKSDEGEDMEVKLEDLSEEQIAQLTKDAAVLDDGGSKLAKVVEDMADKKVNAILEKKVREADIVRFAEDSVTGTDALPLTAERLENALMRIEDEKLRLEFQAMFDAIREKGIIKFTEVGKNVVLEGAGSTPLPAKYIELLDNGKMKPEQLDNPALGLGDLSDYDLSKWQEEKE